MRTVFHNATFHTMEAPGDVHTVMVVEDGAIISLSDDACVPGAAMPEVPVPNMSDAAMSDAPDASARFVDLGGAHVYPAMIDAHLHMLDAIALDCFGVPLCRIEEGRIEPHCLGGIERKIRTYASTRKPGGLMVFSNFVSASMDEGRLPTRFELDAWCDGAMVWVMNIDGHSSSCSTALLEKTGLLGEAPDGILSGPAHDANLGKFTSLLASSITPGALARGVADFCNTCASFGIGTVCALTGTDDVERDAAAKLAVWVGSRMLIDVRLYPQYMDRKKLNAVLPSMGAKRVGGCMKWELDGSIGSRTAAFDEPYLDGTKAELYFDTAELEREVRAFAEEGFQVSAHAIGQAAIDQLLDVLERVSGRHRIDHFEFPSHEAVERACRLQPFITVQPGYAWVDKRYLHGYEKYLDPKIIATQVPLRTLVERGVTLCGSSDAPVQSVDPFLQMRGMREFYIESESLSAYDALATYTVNGGKMLGEKKGMLREGYEASFFCLHFDLLAADASVLDGLRVSEMWLHGKRYEPLSAGFATLARMLLKKPRKL